MWSDGPGGDDGLELQSLSSIALPNAIAVYGHQLISDSAALERGLQRYRLASHIERGGLGGSLYRSVGLTRALALRCVGQGCWCSPSRRDLVVISSSATPPPPSRGGCEGTDSPRISNAVGARISTVAAVDCGRCCLLPPVQTNDQLINAPHPSRLQPRVARAPTRLTNEC
jgi:hypothetical protein